MIIQAPRVMLLGDPGSGKTDVLPTLIQAGLELFVLVTEPSGVESLLDSCHRRDISVDKLHWCVIPPLPPGLKALTQMAATVKALSYRDLAELKQGIAKQEMTAFEAILAVMKDFPCERTKKCYGDLTEWDDTRAFAFDSLSGLNLIAWNHVVGFKTGAHQGEWGTAMGMEGQLINTFSSGCKCIFVLTGHIDRDDSGTRLVPAALGSKLGPTLPRFFSEVIRAKRDGTNFLWSTAESDIALKNRALPVSSKITPDFRPIIDVYNRRKAQLASLAPSEA